MSLALFARSRLNHQTVWVLLISFVVEASLQGRSFVVPMVPWDVIAQTSPLVPAIPAVVALRAVQSGFSPLEGIIGEPARLRRCRLAWSALVIVAIALMQVIATWAATFEPHEPSLSPAGTARNVVAYFAIGLLSAAVVGAELTWLAPLVAMTVLLFFGHDADRAVRGWAVLLKPDADVHSWVAVALLVAVAVAHFGWRDLASLYPTQERGHIGW